MEKKKVTVLTPNGRRQNVTINPSTTILQLLEEVCEKHGFNSKDYGLLHHNTELDLSLMFRYTGLPNNCFLEMIETSRKREETEVTLCIQLQDGSRLQGSFQTSENLFNILQKLCPEKSTPENHPIIIYMRKEIFGDELHKTTLRNLGITSGRAMIRLVNKEPEELKKQASVYIQIPKEPPREEAHVEKKRTKLTTSGFQITTDKLKALKDVENSSEKEEKPVEQEEVKSPVKERVEYDWGSGGRSMNERSEVEAMEVVSEEEEEEMVEEPKVHVLGERNAVLFSLQSAQTVAEDLPDSFFELTVDDIRLILRDLKREAAGNEDTPFLTSKLREIEENNRMLQKLSQYKSCVIRIQFPDRLVLQGTFKPTENLQVVYEFVKKYLKVPNVDFHLFTIPPKVIPSVDKTLLELDFVPTAVLHFGVKDNCDSTDSFLKQELLTKLSSPNGAIIAASKSRGVKKPTTIINENRNQVVNVDTSKGAIPKQPKNDAFRPSSASSGPSGNVPKWFKPIKK